VSRFRFALLAGAALLTWSGNVVAQAPTGPHAEHVLDVRLRTGLHPGFTRIVFDWHEPVGYSFAQQGEAAEIRFDRPARLETEQLGRPVRNLRTSQPLPNGLLLALRPGVRVRHMTIGTRVVLDLLDPSSPVAAPGPLPAPEPAAPAAPPLASVQPVAPAPAAAASAPPPAPPPALQAGAAASVPATPAQPAGSGPPADPAVRLPFTGSAAVLRRSDALIFVFDDARPFDMDALRAAHPALAHAERMEVPGATVLRLSAAVPLALRPAAGGWEIAEAGPATALVPRRVAEDRLLLAAERPGRIVMLPDPETGGLLFVGTVSGSAQAVAAPLRFVGFDLLPTQLGVALAPRADGALLRSVPEGFAVPLAEGPLTAGPERSAAERAAAELPLLLELPDLPPGGLVARRAALLGATAAAPAAARGAVRLDLAATLLALGLGLEAQAVAQLAMLDDPRLAAAPRALLLAASGMVLAGRAEEAAALLADPRLPQQGEAALWRGLARDAGEVPDPALVEAAPIALLYPEPLRARVVPALAATLAEGGAAEAAAALLSEPATSALPLARYARARLQERAGEAEAALGGYGELVAGRDRDARARALGRLAELRLATGQLDAGGAAAALEAAIPAWRGDRRELARRLRAAELHTQSGQPSRALALLRDTEAAFPQAGAETGPAIAEAMRRMLADPETPVLEAVSLLAEHTETVPAGDALDEVAMRLAAQLMRLELPEEAARVLRLAQPRSAAPRRLAPILAEALLAAGDAPAALEMLRGAAQDELPAEARQRNALIEAAALRRLGDAAGAARVLRALGPAGAAPLAELLAAAQDWAGAAAAMREHLAGLPPAPSPLATEARQSLLRLGAFLALAGDEAGLAALGAEHGRRMAEGPLGEAFAALVSGSPAAAELARISRDIARLPLL
jgi:hypothetical protein